MITRYALFDGKITSGDVDGFRAEVLETVVPKWKQMPGALSVRVTFTEMRDDGAPEYPLILAIDYPDIETVQKALTSPQRDQSRIATEAVLARHFEGRIHHHVTQANVFTV